jgi:hypothetical protein
MAMYHYEHGNDNEDHPELRNFLHIDYIYVVYPKEKMKSLFYKKEKFNLVLLCYELIYDNKDWMKQ